MDLCLLGFIFTIQLPSFLQRDQILFQHVNQRLRAVIDFQFAENARHMVLDRLFADTEGFPDVGVAHALRNAF